MIEIRVTTKQKADGYRSKRRQFDDQADRLHLIGQFASGAAHDFNNIIGIIRTHISLIMPKIEDPQIVEDLMRIERATEDSAELTRQMLNFAKPESTELETIYVCDVVRRVTDLIYGWLPTNIHLQTRLFVKPQHPVRINSGHLAQVLTNIVINAVDAMPKGGTLTIDVETQEEKRVNFLVCRVEDTGRGMDQEMLKHIFEPFYTSKPAGRGCGLGLSSSYGLIRAAGGFIKVYSKEGIGTRIEILLPTP